MLRAINIILFLSSLTAILTIIKPKTYMLDDNFEDMRIFIRKNTKFYIKMNGNPTTGYTWMVTNANSFKSIIKPLNLNEYNSTDELKAISADHNMVGSGSSYYFLFIINKKSKLGSKVDIQFTYKRPWMDSANDTIKTVHVNIVF